MHEFVGLADYLRAGPGRNRVRGDVGGVDLRNHRRMAAAVHLGETALRS